MPIITTNKLVAVDTNVLIYLHDKSDEKKRKIAEEVLADCPKISTQVLSEYLNVTRRLLDLSKAQIIAQCASLFKYCEVVSVSHYTLQVAAEIIDKFDLQIFDSIIIASALEANCTVLYSEDMQHGLVIDRITIINPFL